jgi:DNA ligase (NAD+)
LRQVSILPVKKIKVKNTQIAGKTFVLTGTLSSLDRDEARRLIKNSGGEVSSAVSSNTDFVVAGENPGSKYNKAKELRVTILSENEFLRLIK